jgi:uncharacterized membrane protein (Fun14 family)
MSDTYAPHADGQPSLTRAFRTMPGWKIKLLGLGLVVGVVGLVAQFVSSGLRHTAPVATTPPTHVAPAGPGAVAPPGASGFVGGQPTSDTGATTPTPAPDATAPAQPPSLTDKLTPTITKVGFSLFIGVVVGVVFRTFIRMAAALTVVVVAAAAALSYFHVINVDLSSVKAQSGQVTSWLVDQGMRLKDMIFAHLPSTTAAGAGFLFGMKRR